MKHALSGSTKELSLISSEISKILAFKGYINYLEDKGEKVEDYLAIEKDKFDTFRQVVWNRIVEDPDKNLLLNRKLLAT